MQDLFATITDFIADTRGQLAAARADGKLTASEAFQLFVSAIERLVQAASTLPASGADKKAAVLAAVEKLYDEVLAPLDIPYIPNVIESTIVDPALKKLAVEFAGGIVEHFVSRLPAAA